MALTKSPTDWPSRVRRRIKWAFAGAELTAAEAARQLGWSQSYLSHRLTGRTAFDLNDLQRIADLLEMSPADLTAVDVWAASNGL